MGSEVLSQSKISKTPLGVEPATYRQCLIQLRLATRYLEKEQLIYIDKEVSTHSKAAIWRKEERREGILEVRRVPGAMTDSLR